uniref:SH3 domain-containing protein n=2 Tax=Panagrolaimus sp. PS1159 TaxID=55785 RepID=A0AC35F7E5_9BILA
MAAKDYSLSFKNEQNINIEDALNGQYTNFNLKQNHQNLSNAFVELPKTVSTEKRKVLNSDFLNHDDLQAKKLSHSWTKSTKMLPSNFENDDSGKEDNLKKRNNSIANYNSTISLHILAYENLTEDSFDKKKECLKQIDLNKFLENAQQISIASASVIQNPFEFSRQQYDNVLEPEMSRYKASQRLINLNAASAYENLTEDSSDSFDKRKDCLKQNDLNKFLESAKQISIASASIIHNPFEFPRQQYDNVLEPEMSKFKASQRLINLNATSGSQKKSSRLGSFRSTMAQKVRAAYDFDAQPGSGELSIRENEILTVIRENIEGGWIEGRNAKGQVGLFPESYVDGLKVEMQKAKLDYFLNHM